MKYQTTATVLMLWVCMLPFWSKAAETVTSPDNSIKFLIEEKSGCLYYSIDKGGEAVTGSSKLGLSLKEYNLMSNLKIENVKRASNDDSWYELWGEESSVRNHYNQLTVAVRNTKTKVKMNVEVRVFDDGVGFRYVIPKQAKVNKLTVIDEITEFAIANNAVTWSIPSNHTSYYEGLYRKLNVVNLDTVCTPLTMRMNDNLYISIHEANLTDYAKMNLTPKEGSTTLKADLTPWTTGEKVFAENELTTPWRIVIIADKPGDLLLSRMMLNLNEPCKIKDTSWIEPGRYIGIWWSIHMGYNTWSQGEKHGATTANTKRYIDFAAAHGFSGVLAEGWNTGWDTDWTKYGNLFSFTQSTPDFDLEEVSRYAREKGVRFIAHDETGGAAKNLENQMEAAFTLYNNLGINTVKTGYVSGKIDGKERHDSQYGVRHYRKVVETAARHHIMIDNHEPVMPTGIQRTYPNFMTQEGVRGQEYNAWAVDGGNPSSHTVTLPFTRALAGPMDYTPNVFNHHNTIHAQTQPGTTKAGEVALNVILYSPLQMAADMIENYENEPAMEFVTKCPTTWDKTLVPEAEIGSYITMARKERNSERWFVGSHNGEQSRITNIPLSFLDKGAAYTARIFTDGADADCHKNPNSMKVYSEDVTSETVLKLSVATGGGAAIILEKKK